MIPRWLSTFEKPGCIEALHRPVKLGMRAEQRLQWHGQAAVEHAAKEKLTKADFKESMKKNDLKRQVSEAIQACQEKKAEEITILELEKGSGAFTDYFVVCSGTNPRQIQTIADAVEERLKQSGLRPAHSEGYKQAEWVLLDYVDFVVHIFSEKSRKYYDLERLWKSAKKLEQSELATALRRSRVSSAGARKKRA